MADLSAVLLPGADAEVAARLAARVPGDVDAALGVAVELGRALPLPGAGGTATLWSALATLAAADLAVARAVEPHLDAVAILAEAGGAAPAGAWGVFAAEGPGLRLEAVTDGDAAVLTGTKPWCSLADRLDGALVTAWAGDARRLYAVGLRDPRVRVLPGAWHALGLAAVPSGPVEFDRMPAEPVGEPGWYLERPGFAWGGMGVAACWFGGAVALALRLTAAARDRVPDQIALAAVGRTDRALHAARTVLAAAAADVDAGRAVGDAGALLAARVRGVVAEAAETVLAVVGHALGPAPLTQDARHAQRVADLTVYVRQHHAERDDAALGRAVLAAGGAA